MNRDNQDRHRDLAREVVARLQSAGFTAYWAGGCVRDILLGRLPKDYDVATNATPEEICALFPGAIETGKVFGVIRAKLEDFDFEIATFRRDHSYRDGRRPESVSYTDPRTDAERRDFTINAIFYDPVADATHDFVGGRRDIAARVVRCVGRPADRFAEDHLRMLRAVRMATTLGFSLESETASAIRANAELILRISAERIRDELTRLLLESVRAGDAINLLDEVGLLENILPEARAMKGVQQPPEYHPEGDVFTHTVAALNLMGARSLRLAYSTLLHDVGKPDTATVSPERIRFDRHAEKGAELAEGILSRLRFQAEDIRVIVHCVRNHMNFLQARQMRKSTLRRFVGADAFDVEMELHRLDCLASHSDLSTWEFLAGVREKFENEPVLPEPWVTGRDIMGMGVPEGPAVGMWKKAAYDAQLEGRYADREALLSWLQGEVAKQTT